MPAWTGSLAMVAAVGLWTVAVFAAGGLDAVTGQRSQLQVVLVGLLVIDLVAAWKGRRGRVGLPILLWVFLRAVAAAGGLVLLALPAYAVAMFAWTATPRQVGSRDGRHRFQPVANAWRDSVVPPPFQKNLAGAHANASTGCLVCGAGPDDPRHAPPGDGDSG